MTHYYITGAKMCVAANCQWCLCRPGLPRELWICHQTIVSGAPEEDKWPDRPILEREDERIGLEPLLLLPPTKGSTLVPPPVTPSLNSRRKLHTDASKPSPKRQASTKTFKLHNRYIKVAKLLGTVHKQTGK